MKDSVGVNFLRQRKKRIAAVSFPFFIAIFVVFFNTFFGSDAILEFLHPDRALAAAISWDGGGDGVSWSDAANWSGDVQPGADDDVLIDANVTVDISTQTTINSLTLGNGSGTTNPTLNFAYDALSSGALTLDDGDLTVNTGATITHSAGTSAVVGTLYIDVQLGDANVIGTIHADEKGYSAGNGPGAGGGVSGGLGGGSYGGVGGIGNDTFTGTAGEVYGSMSAPVNLGSGGAGSTAGGGGGAVRLAVVGTLTVTGTVSANGGSTSLTNRGGGSGGSVYLSVGTLAGAGTVTANGGSGDENTSTHPGSGGGGRVAVYYDTLSMSDTNIRAYGGFQSLSIYSVGGAGTVYLKDTAAVNPDLIIDNNDHEGSANDDRFIGRTKLTPTGTPLSLTVDELIIRNKGNLNLTSNTTILYSTITWSDAGIITDNAGTLALIAHSADVTIPLTSTLYANRTKTWNSLTVNGRITHSNSNTTANGELHKINLTSSTDITIAASGSIDANERGYMEGNGPGVGVNQATGSGGASFGGVGGVGNDDGSGTAGEVYGSMSAPTSLGSGGGISSSSVTGGSRGGGAIRLTASSGTVTVNGSITTNATTEAVPTGAGGGSGGSVYISANTLAGSGTITANGGAGDADSTRHPGSGGGGRVAVYYDSLTLSNANIRAFGGVNVSATNALGGAGTVYLKDNAVTNPDLIIDNNDTAMPTNDDRFIGRTKLTPTSTPLSLTVDELILRNQGHLRLTSDTTIAYTTFSWTDAVITDGNGTLAGVSSGDLIVPAGGTFIANTARSYDSATINGELIHSQNKTAETYKIDITTTGNFTVDAAATIDLSGSGYASMNGPGAGQDSGTWGSGAGHGGVGGVTDDIGSSGGAAYDTSTAPVNIGSGGGDNTGSTGGGFGGGAIKLTVGGDLSLGANINANAGTLVGTDDGGGSGGSIWLIVTGAFTGSGNLTANGGDGQESRAGAGAGGRIRYECGSGTWSGSTSVVGGSVGHAAGSGTVTSSCSLGAGNTAPTVATINASQITDGSGEVSISFDADDADDDDTVEALVEYDIGGGFTKATLSTDNADTTADFGDPTINNADTYPVGESGAYILTSSGANTVNIIWLASTDEPTADTSSAQIRVTLYDGTDVGTAGTSATFNLDVVAPTVSSASYKDTNSDGTVDRVDVVFDEALSLSSYDASDWSFPTAGSVNLSDTGASVSSSTVQVAVSADANETGGSVNPTVLYTNNANRLTDASGNPVATFGAAQTVTDAAAPYILSHTPTNNATGVAVDADVVVNFTEAMSTGTLTYTISTAPSGLSEAWTDGDTTLTVSHTGDFSAGAHDFEITALNAAAGSPAALAGALSPAANPFTFTVTATNNAPVVSAVTASQITDGSGEVTVSFEVDDADDDDTVEALVEYDIGGGFTKATLSTDNADTTADFGDPTINNADTYPVGESGAYILTSSGSNTINVVWLASTDESAADVSDAQIRITVYDGTDAGTPATSSTFNLDVVAPTVSSASYKDTNGNGTVDRVDVVFDEALSLSSYNTADWSFPTAGSINLDDTDAAPISSTLQIAVSADTNETGGTTNPTVLYTNNANRLTDTSGNPVATFGAAQTVTDAAAPYILSHVPTSGSTGIAVDADVVVNFTEAINTASLTYTISTPPTGLSEAWTNGDTTLTISHTGDFSAGSHTVEITAADAAAGNPVALAGALSPAANPFSFSVTSANTAPTVATITAAQITDGSGEVSISFDADDADDDDTVEALVEYDIGGGFTKATLSTDNADTTADFGDPTINNADTYPVGESGAYILTSSGSNTVNVIWLASTDEPTADTSSAQIRVTLYDGTDAGTAGTSSAFNLDVVAPTVSSASYKDTNADGTVDRVDVVFDEALTLSSYDSGDWSFSTTGSINLDDTNVTISSNTAQVTVSADANETGGLVNPQIRYFNNGSRLTDTSGNAVLTFGSAQTVTDAAAPFILSTSPTNGASNVSPSADMVVSFTEAMDTGSVTYTFSDAPTGISAGWTNADTTLTLEHSGDFTSGSHTFEVTAADAASGSVVALAGALSPAANPTSFSVSVPPSGGGGGGGSSLVISVTNNSLNFTSDDACITTNSVVALLKASNAESVILSEDPLFIGAQWEGFVADPQLVSYNRNTRIDAQEKFWTFATPGTHTLYARFRSRTGNISSIVSDTVTIDVSGTCEEEVDENEGEAEGGDAETVEEGEYIQPNTISEWIYFIGKDLARHPVLNVLTFLTHKDTLDIIREVTDSTVSRLPLGKPVLPKEERVLIKFASDPKVYTIYQNPIDEYAPVLRWIPNEQIAERIIGAEWQEYIFELQPAFFPRFVIGTDMGQNEIVDTSNFITFERLKELELLNQ